MENNKKNKNNKTEKSTHFPTGIAIGQPSNEAQTTREALHRHSVTATSRKVTIRANRVETLSLLSNLGQTPPPQTMFFSYRQLFLFPLPTLKGRSGGRGRSASGKCNVKVILIVVFPVQCLNYFCRLL